MDQTLTKPMTLAEMMAFKEACKAARFSVRIVHPDKPINADFDMECWLSASDAPRDARQGPFGGILNHGAGSNNQKKNKRFIY
jgi:hypothetical protein